ncbi:MAG: hypothetical protein COA78_19670 [Blastopirellula sp.]|nr:MAG: hypothetical protein COA78_19670 [Blastopirellula sp.]
MSTNHPKRIQYGLRLLFGTVLLLGVGFAWIGAQLRWMQQRNEALQWIQPMHARQIAASSGLPVPPVKGFYVQRSGSTAPWSLAIFGEIGVDTIELDSRYSQSEDHYTIDRLRSLFPEAEVVEAR